MIEIANKEQAEHWSGASGDTWVAKQPMFDALMAPVLDLLMAHAELRSGMRVIDIGCGTGASLLAAAQAVGPEGYVAGLDVSAPMLGLARERVAEAGASQIECVLGDAQVHAFATGACDHVISRFGVMFFSDPVAAFANIRSSLRPKGCLTFVCWAGLAGNPWFRDPIEVAISVVGAPPAADPRAPGPMAFSDPGYVEALLAEAGYEEIRVGTVDTNLTPTGTLSNVIEFAASEGPAARILREMGGTSDDVAEIKLRLSERMENYHSPDGVRVPARLHLVSARAAP